MSTGRAALVISAGHVVLLLFPPLPPLHKGSLWSYLLGYLAVILAWRSLSEWGPRAASWWAREGPAQRMTGTLAAFAVVAAAALLVRAAVPDTFARFSREEGLWEPVTLFGYGAAGLLLVRAARYAEETLGRHLRLVAAGFLFLVLEEIDYFGIFGGIIGRIDGIYVGSLHDLVRLQQEGLLPTLLTIGLGLAAVAIAFELLRRGYVQPSRLVRMMTSSQGAWLLAGLAFQVLALIEEAGLFGFKFAPPTPEELIEMFGALCLVAFALELLRDVPGPELTIRHRREPRLETV